MVYATFDYEQQFWQQGYSAIVGIDEVGRGSWSGPLVAAGVIFPPYCNPDFILADSKLLSAKLRQALVKPIIDTAVKTTIAVVPVSYINRYGVGEACQKAYRTIVKNLSPLFDYVFIDAFTIRGVKKRTQYPMKQGDKLSASIAAASILAKVYRDNLMTALDQSYPNYGFAVHKGYGTKKHQAAIKTYGLSNIHRTSFDLTKFLPETDI